LLTRGYDWLWTKMTRKEITSTLLTLSERSVHGGGFSEHSGSLYRPDATAWAVLALNASGGDTAVLASARSRLGDDQLSDGRVCMAKEQPHAYWPTALAIMAWYSNRTHAENIMKACDFLIKSGGLTFQKRSNAPSDHDPSIPGWPWIDNTFSWVEPTTLSILALSLVGYSKHARVSEGVRLLIDRQLPSGGWNYGGTIVYGQELYPQPESTGMALTALAGKVEKREIQRSLDYLKSQAISCRTPLSLGWTLFGLGSWGERPIETRRWIVEGLSRQKKFGAYGTTLLSLILLAYEAKGGFLETISLGNQSKWFKMEGSL